MESSWFHSWPLEYPKEKEKRKFPPKKKFKKMWKATFFAELWVLWARNRKTSQFKRILNSFNSQNGTFWEMTKEKLINFINFRISFNMVSLKISDANFFFSIFDLKRAKNWLFNRFSDKKFNQSFQRTFERIEESRRKLLAEQTAIKC